MGKSEFGKGLTYCLALFLCHSEREYWSRDEDNEIKKIMDRADMWFNGASDHLYDLEIPDNLPLNLKKRLAKLCSKSIHWGHGFDMGDTPTKDDKKWAIQEAKDLIRLIDKFHGIETIKGDWE